jgi:hypothetical protein
MFYEIAMLVIASFAWLLIFIFLVLCGLFVLVMMDDICTTVYNYVNPGEEEDE